jgi:hypothetical protein
MDATVAKEDDAAPPFAANPEAAQPKAAKRPAPAQAAASSRPGDGHSDTQTQEQPSMTTSALKVGDLFSVHTEVILHSKGERDESGRGALSVLSAHEVQKRISYVPGVESVTVNYAAGPQRATTKLDK